MKKFIVNCILILSTVCAIAIAFSIPKNCNQTYAADNLNSNYAFSDYMTIYSNSNILSNINEVENNKNLNKYEYSIVSNNATTFSFNVIDNIYDFSEVNRDIFSITKTTLATLNPSQSIDNKVEFELCNKKYTFYYTIDGNFLHLYTSQTKTTSTLKISNITSDGNSGLYYDSQSKTISCISSISYNFSLTSTKLKIFAKKSGSVQKTFIFDLEKPIAKFSSQNEPFVIFDCETKNGDTYSNYIKNWIPSERIFESVTVSFIKNYTETNPLFININLNGFTYFYKLFFSENQLIFQYIDINKDGVAEVENKIFNVYNNSLSEESSFNIKFDEIGRYQLEFYDLTYNESLSVDENLDNFANYYTTSFYIYDSNIDNYKNIYLVSQSLQDGSPAKYVVSTSTESVTLNTNLRIIFKNLYMLDEETFKKIKIEITKTLFTGSIISETTTYNYTNSFMQQCYNEKTDYYLDFVDDARYKINVYYDNNQNALISTSYEVVKLPKTMFQIGNEGDPYYDKYIEEQLYTKTEKYYSIPRYSNIFLNLSYKNVENEMVNVPKENSQFSKTYMNNFKIFFGISQINISKYTRLITDSDGSTSKASTLDIKIESVGKTNVTVSYNGNLQRYTFEDGSEKLLSFSEFGDYTITVEDEIGTILSRTFSYNKTMNTSTIILIILSSILLLGIVSFILISRAKVKTR